MKFKNPISFLILFLLISVTCFSQSIVNRANSSYTVQDARLAAQYNLLTPRYADSTAANLQIGIDTCGAVVYLYSTHTFWYRSCASSTKKWVEIGSGGGGGGTWGSITGTLSNQTDLQTALNLKAPLASPTFTGTVTMPSPFTLGATSVTSTGTQLNYLNAATGTTGTASTNIVYSTSPLFVTPRLASTSTTGYVWTATDASGNGSFQAIPSYSLYVQNAGSGTQTWFTSNDTLYLKRIKNATVSATTDTDSSLLLNVTDADRGDITVSGTGTTWTIDNDVVTFAKFQNITQARLLGRYTASTGDMQEISIGSGLSLDAGTGVLSVTGGGSTFQTLSDGPGSFAGQAGKSVRVNVGETALEYFSASGSGTVTSIDAAGTGVFSFTGGPVTAAGTLTLVATGTSGGIPYFSAGTTLSSSGALTASAIVLGGGAGSAPTSLALGTANQMLGMNSGATANEYKTLAVGTSGTDFAIAHTANTVTFNLPDAGASNRGAVTTGTQTFAGVKTFSSIPVLSAGLQTFSTAAQSNLNVPSSRSLASTTEGGVQLGGATTTNVRVSIYGSASATIAANSAYSSLVVGANVVTEASSGTNPIIANVGIGVLSVSNGAGATANTASLYIQGAPTGITPTGGNYAFLINAGDTRTNGNVLIGGAAAGTSATLTLALFNGTIPSTSPADGVQLYSEDVAASAELKVRDEAGNITTISPHNFTGIPDGRSEEMAWSFYSEKNGEYVNVDMLKLARLVEELTGEKLVYTGDSKKKPNPSNK